ncbi:FtsX-like permease family protein [Microbispora catharanthi]|uniref:FtsX-like permease family protein n=2 Tax=Microbispora catharanthi TaxID=1712871 RepID=A0A5N6BJP0_9ACTN|nr:FtsX-like permease family protein [Microbispora catharanthi]
MGRILLILRLAIRDLRRRPVEAVLMILVIGVATTTLTIGLALYGVTDKPYQQTRAATAGPDVVASLPAGPGQSAVVDALIHASGVTGHSGPYPLAFTVIGARGRTADVMAEGRDLAPASIDQPKPTQGSWVRDGGVVIERSFADALGVHVGDQVTLGGRSFRVVGMAVTAGLPAYPGGLCSMGCASIPASLLHSSRFPTPGLVWLTKPAATALATSAGSLSYLLNLKLANPAQAQAFAIAHNANWSPTEPILSPWQRILDVDNLVVENAQQAMRIGGWLFGLLAVAGLAVLVGRRMVEQTRRVGLLKAVGGTPGLVASVLLAEHLVLALAAAAVGLVAGWLAAPPFARTGAGLIGTPGAPSLTVSAIVLILAVALAVALAATLVPAIRAARTSTVSALADEARPPRRRAWLIAVSARLPVPMLLGLRLTARRPRRAVLSALSVAITVTGIVTILANDSYLARHFSHDVDDPRIDRINQLMAMITIMLVVLATINMIAVTWATKLDARRSSALSRALGATPGQVSAGLSAAQLLPALPGAVVGIPVGIYLCDIFRHGVLTIPSPGWLLLVLLGTPLVVAGLTAIPSRLGAHRSVAEILRSELA